MARTRQLASVRQAHPDLDAVAAALGLSPRDARLYTTLVQAGQAAVPDLADAAGVTPAVAEIGVRRLVAAGAVRRCSGGGVRYRAVSPDLMFGPQLAEREASLREAREAVRKLEDLHRAGGSLPTPADLIEVVVGADEIGATVERLVLSSQHRIRGFDTPPYVHDPSAVLMAEAPRMPEGVQLQVVYSPEAASWPGRMERDILPGVRQGEQARIGRDVPVKLMIFDDEVAVLPVVSDVAARQTVYVVRSTAMIASLVALFELVWESASPVTTEPAGHVPADDPDFGPLLNLLAAGQTDAGIARALGWSERTTQRRVQRLLAVLGARTRFQAGIAARSRGWLSA